jgi:retron-type reverse transcriptase
VAVAEVQGQPPYRLARFGSRSGHFLDLTTDQDDAALAERDMPVMRTPDDIARWLGMKLGRLAWLAHHFTGGRPESPQKSHYVYCWLAKSRGGHRLIESPKKLLKQAQERILRDILERIPLHSAAHGFCPGRSIVTNAQPHAGQYVVLKWDLENFYANVGFSRVTAIFRSVGYGREAAIWLARLTTTALPGNAPFPPGDPSTMYPYLRRHLPQGAPTSPTLANLSAYRLDVRLSGLARSFGAKYTRYADDLTFSGDARFAKSLRVFIPLVRQICHQERFRVHPQKRKVLRRHQRQRIAGVVVNDKPNIARDHYDRLKATLVNCVRSGPSTQNREGHDNFAAHLQGSIAHVLQLNRRRGEKLGALFQRIDWSR